MSDKRVKKWLQANRKKAHVINSRILINDKALFNKIASIDISIDKALKVGNSFDGRVTIDLKDSESLEYFGRYKLDHFNELYGFTIIIDL